MCCIKINFYPIVAANMRDAIRKETIENERVREASFSWFLITTTSFLKENPRSVEIAIIHANLKTIVSIFLLFSQVIFLSCNDF